MYKWFVNATYHVHMNYMDNIHSTYELHRSHTTYIQFTFWTSLDNNFLVQLFHRYCFCETQWEVGCQLEKSAKNNWKRPLAITHDDLGGVWNSYSLQAVLLVILAGNPILETCSKCVFQTSAHIFAMFLTGYIVCVLSSSSLGHDRCNR